MTVDILKPNYMYLCWKNNNVNLLDCAPTVKARVFLRECAESALKTKHFFDHMQCSLFKGSFELSAGEFFLATLVM